MPPRLRIRDRAALTNKRWPGSGDPRLMDVTQMPIRACGTLSPQGNAGQPLANSGVAYFWYIETVRAAYIPAHCYIKLDTAAVGTQIAEIGFFSTPSPPNKSGQTLTLLTSTNVVDDLTAAAPVLRGNTSAFTYEVANGTNLWGGFRCKMQTTQPRIATWAGDRGLGYGLFTASANTLLAASATSWTGTLFPVAAFTASGVSVIGGWATTF